MGWSFRSLLFNGVVALEKFEKWRFTLRRPKMDLHYVCFFGSLSSSTAAAVTPDSSRRSDSKTSLN